MAIITLAEAQSWLVDTPSEDEPVITTLIAAAETYLSNATGNTFDSTNALAKVFCLVLVTDWYENREMIGKVSDKVRPTITGLLTQLSHCYTTEVIA
jgi:uncharacterized phage protein (predicted DNA packaging)